MIQQIYTSKKKSLVQFYAVIDASTEDPGGGIIGKVLYSHPSKAEVLLSNSITKRPN